jgi:hypothetical protein
MTFLIIAYTLIAVVLSGYGMSIWRRISTAEAKALALE